MAYFEDNGDAKYEILNVMPDYGGAYLWGAYQGGCGVGCNIAVSGYGYEDNVPISSSLQSQFHDWQLRFERCSFEGEVYSWQGEKIEWDWELYHTEGIRLAKLLKQEVGDAYRVVYVKPYEDSNQKRECTEILADGNEYVLNSINQ